MWLLYLEKPPGLCHGLGLKHIRSWQLYATTIVPSEGVHTPSPLQECWDDPLLPTRNSSSFTPAMTPSTKIKQQLTPSAGLALSSLELGMSLAATSMAALSEPLPRVLAIHQFCLTCLSSSVSVAFHVVDHLLRLCNPLHCFPFDIYFLPMPTCWIVSRDLCSKPCCQGCQFILLPSHLVPGPPVLFWL